MRSDGQRLHIATLHVPVDRDVEPSERIYDGLVLSWALCMRGENPARWHGVGLIEEGLLSTS